MRAGFRKINEKTPVLSLSTILFNRCVLLGAVLVFSGSCSSPFSAYGLYNSLEENLSKKFSHESDDTILVSAGNLNITSKSFFYRISDEKIITSNDIHSLNHSVKSALLGKAMLRKMALHDGKNLNLFESDEAEAFILPHLEKIMEDYYYKKMSENAGNVQNVKIHIVQSLLKKYPAIEITTNGQR